MENIFGPTETDLKIKELANNVATTPMRDSSQFMADIQKTISDGVYGTQDEAIKGVLEYANSKGVTYKGVDSNRMLSEINEKITQSKKTSFLDKTLESAKGGLGRIKAAGEGIVSGEYDIDEAFARGAAGALQTFFSPVAGLVGEGIEAIPEDVKQSLLETATPTIEGITAWYQEQTPEQQRNLANIGVGAEIIAEFIGVKGVQLGGKKIIKEGLEIAGKGVDLKDATVKKAGDIVDTIKPTTTDNKLLKNLGLETEKGKIGDIEVDIPKTQKTISEKVVDMFPGKTEKELAGRAVSPRTIGKNAKQKLRSVADVEVNTKKFYDNIRTGVLKGDIDTIENAAQTIVNNIDIVGARIGNAVKKVDGVIDIDNKLTDEIIDALNTKGAEVSPATSILSKFYNSLGDGRLNIADAYELKKAYANEVTKLYKAGDAGTKQYKALSDGVKFLSTKIDEIIDTKLGKDFANDKLLFRELKTIVDDMVASSLVEGRRSPNTLAEQIGMVESIFSPVNSAKMKLIQTVGEQNTRGGAWKQLIKQYDAKSVKNFNTVPVKVPVNTPELEAIKTMPIKTTADINRVTDKIIAGLTITTANAKAVGQIIKEFIKKHGESFKDKLGELFDDLADKTGARSKFIDDKTVVKKD